MKHIVQRAAYFVLSNQYVCVGSWVLRCVVGAGMGMICSGEISDWVFWKGGVLNGAQGHVLVFKGKGVAATQNANDLGAGNLVLDSSKKPWTLDAKGTKGGHKGQDRLGILTIDGDSLKWCVSLGKNRPADFKTGGQNFCLSLKKKK